MQRTSYCILLLTVGLLFSFELQWFDSTIFTQIENISIYYNSSIFILYIYTNKWPIMVYILLWGNDNESIAGPKSYHVT